MIVPTLDIGMASGGFASMSLGWIVSFLCRKRSKGAMKGQYHGRLIPYSV